MAEITEFNTLSIKNLLGELQQYRYNPTLIQRRILDHLSDITAGKVDIVDPTNPFIYLLEASSVNTALAIQENTILTRRQYPALSQNQEDLYLHMSNWDYLDRFATPATANFQFYFELNSLLNEMVDMPLEEYCKSTIPRNTEVIVDGITFSLQYPIDIYKYYSGIVQVKYDATQTTPLQTLSTNVIDYQIKTDASNTRWLAFEVPLSQFKIISAEFPVQLSRPFIEQVTVQDQYYVTRVYHRASRNAGWVEMKTTHTDQIYDPYTPTAVLQVFDGQVRVFIPPVYIMNGLVTGTVRIDTYGTRGHVDINFANYELKAFTTQLLALDENADTNAFTNALQQTTFFSFTGETVVSGTAAVPFDHLRSLVVSNSIGDRQLPITPTQIEYYVDRKGFTLYKNVDVITNRIFIATKNIPRSRNRHPITPMLLTVAQLVDTAENISSHQGIYTQEDRITIPSGVLMELVNSQLVILDQYEKTRLEALSKLAMTEEINSRQLLVNPYHYVMDFSRDELDLRVYSLDYPNTDKISFLYQNPTLQLAVNTGSHSIEKKSFGYRLTITTKSGDNYKKLADEEVGVQLAFQPPGESYYGYINGLYLGKNSDNERVFQFDLHTEYDIDPKHRLYFTNFQIVSNSLLHLPSPLAYTFQILHYTNSFVSAYRQSASDQLLGRFILDGRYAVVTHEELDITFGLALDNLWRHYRSSLSGNDYQTYQQDVPMVYDEDVYDIDPYTGSVFHVNADNSLNFHLLHRKGDIVYNTDGEIVYQHRSGDVKLDVNGNPLRTNGIGTVNYLDLVLMDYKHYLATREDHVEYRRDVIATMDKWITQDLENIDKVLLEQTRLFFRPKKNIGRVLVLLKDGIEDYIDILQSFHVKYYVGNAAYNDIRIRQNIEYRTIEIISSVLESSTVTISEMIIQLQKEFDRSIRSVSITGLGGAHNLDMVTITEAGTSLALKKKLTQQEDGHLTVEEDVMIEFIDIEED